MISDKVRARDIFAGTWCGRALVQRATKIIRRAIAIDYVIVPIYCFNIAKTVYCHYNLTKLIVSGSRETLRQGIGFIRNVIKEIIKNHN